MPSTPAPAFVEPTSARRSPLLVLCLLLPGSPACDDRALPARLARASLAQSSVWDWRMDEELWVTSARHTATPTHLILGHDLLATARAARDEGRALSTEDYLRRAEEVRHWVQAQSPEDIMVLSSAEARGALLTIDTAQAAASELPVFSTVTSVIATADRYMIEDLSSTPDYAARGGHRLAAYERNMAYDHVAEQTWRELWSLAESDPELRRAVNATLSEVGCQIGLETLDSCIPESVSDDLGRQQVMDTLAALQEQGTLTADQIAALKDGIADLTETVQETADQQREDLQTILELTVVDATQDDDYERGLQDLAVGQSKILRFVRDTRAAEAARLQEMRQRQKTELQLRAMESAVFMFGTLVDRALGDPRAGKVFQVIGSAQVQMIRSVKEFIQTTSKVSKLAGGIVLSGNLLSCGLSVAQTLMSLDEPDPQAIIMEQLESISQQVYDLHVAMNERLDRVDIKLSDITLQMSAGFADMADALSNVAFDISQIQQSLLSLHEDLVGMELRLAESSRYEIRTSLWSIQDTVLQQRDISFDDYLATEHALYDYVNFHAYAPSLSARWSDDMPDLLWRDAGPEYYMEGLSQYPGTLPGHAPLSVFMQPNPVDYSAGATAYARLRELWPEHARAAEAFYRNGRERLEAIINVGKNLRYALSRVPDHGLWQGLIRRYQEALQETVVAVNDVPGSDDSPLGDDPIKHIHLWASRLSRFDPVVARDAVQRYATYTEDAATHRRTWYLPRCEAGDPLLLPGYERVLAALDECGYEEECLAAPDTTDPLTRDFLGSLQRIPWWTPGDYAASYRELNSLWPFVMAAFVDPTRVLSFCVEARVIGFDHYYSIKASYGGSVIGVLTAEAENACEKQDGDLWCTEDDEYLDRYFRTDHTRYHCPLDCHLYGPPPNSDSNRRHALPGARTTVKNRLAEARDVLYEALSRRLSGDTQLRRVAIQVDVARRMMQAYATIAMPTLLDRSEAFHALLFGDGLIGVEDIAALYALAHRHPPTNNHFDLGGGLYGYENPACRLNMDSRLAYLEQLVEERTRELAESGTTDVDTWLNPVLLYLARTRTCTEGDLSYQPSACGEASLGYRVRRCNADGVWDELSCELATPFDDRVPTVVELYNAVLERDPGVEEIKAAILVEREQYREDLVRSEEAMDLVWELLRSSLARVPTSEEVESAAQWLLAGNSLASLRSMLDDEAALCGNGRVGGEETCDDGNLVADDGCSLVCQVEPGWRCAQPGQSCTGVCGDGLVRGSEACDDAGPSQWCTRSCRVVPDITAGGSHTCVLNATGVVKCWGSNRQGQLGVGMTSRGRNHHPTAVDGLTEPGVAVRSVTAGASHTCALLSDGRVKCWGWNKLGQLGHGSIGGSSASPVTVVAAAGDSAPLTGVVAIAAGGHHNCVAMQDGGAKCWGSTAFGQVGNGQSDTRTVQAEDQAAPVDVIEDPDTPSELLSEVTGIFAGHEHTCASLEGGSAKCWGSRFSGELGDGLDPGWSASTPQPLDMDEPAPVFSMMDGGWRDTCALTVDGGVWCWGDNRYGQLGVGSVGDEPRSSPVPTGSSYSFVATGDSHTCGITGSSGNVRCWGEGVEGALGNGRTESRAAKAYVLAGPRSSARLSGAVRLAAGSSHTCALLRGGGAKCWGSNAHGQIGVGYTTELEPLPRSVDLTQDPVQLHPVTVTASSQHAGCPASNAVDGDPSTSWSSGAFRPGWIELDFGRPVSAWIIRLRVSQYPAGNTNHRIFAGLASDPSRYVRQLNGHTESGQWIGYVGDGLEGVRYIRIATTDSPSWVAWNEIEVFGQPESELVPVSVTASSEYAGRPASNAVDGDPSTSWSSGAFDPGWIELDFGRPVSARIIRLRVSQYPAGNTIHHIYAGPTPDPSWHVQQVEGYTESGQWIDYVGDGLEGVRYIRIATTDSPSWVAWYEIQVFGQPPD